MHLIAETYKYLKFYNRIVDLKGLVWGIFGGFVIGIALSYYHKVYLGKVVRALLDRDASGKESAMTLNELGIKASFGIRRALFRRRILRKVISVANPEECEIPTQEKTRGKFISLMLPERDGVRYDFDKMKLYIDEENRYRAGARYELKHKINLVYVFLFILLLAGLTFVVYKYAVPDLLRMLDNFIGMSKS